MPLNALNHFLIFAKDLDSTRDFYVEILGLKVGARPKFPFPGYWLYIGDNACVHVAPAEVGAAQKEYLGERPLATGTGTGAIDHVAFQASGLGDILARLEARGIEAMRRTVPEDGTHQVFIDDPDGIRVELTFACGELEQLQTGP